MQLFKNSPATSALCPGVGGRCLILWTRGRLCASAQGYKHCPVAKASLCPSHHCFCMDFKLIFSEVTPVPLKGTGSMTGALSSSSSFLWKITMEKWRLKWDSPGQLNLGSITPLTEHQHGCVPMCYELPGIYCCRIP